MPPRCCRRGLWFPAPPTGVTRRPQCASFLTVLVDWVQGRQRVLLVGGSGSNSVEEEPTAPSPPPLSVRARTRLLLGQVQAQRLQARTQFGPGCGFSAGKYRLSASRPGPSSGQDAASPRASTGSAPPGPDPLYGRGLVGRGGHGGCVCSNSGSRVGSAHCLHGRMRGRRRSGA